MLIGEDIMFESVIEAEHDLRNIDLREISNLLKKWDADISEGVLFFSGLRGAYNYAFYSVDDSVSNAGVLTIQPNQSLTFSLMDAARSIKAKNPEKNKLLIVPLDNFALSELERHFAEEHSKIHGFEVNYRKTPLIDYDMRRPVPKSEIVFVGRYAFDPLQNAKRIIELEEMRDYFINVFSGPEYS